MISTVDVMHWILSLGRRPIRRELPNQRLVLVSRHLGSAQRRLSRVRISDRQRRQLTGVLGRVTEAAEARLRDNLRPKITAALGRRWPIAAKPAGEDFPHQAGRRAIGSDRRAGLSHARGSSRCHFAEPAQGARLFRSEEFPPRRRRIADEWLSDRDLGRRLRAGRLLFALDFAIQPSDVRHGDRAVSHVVLFIPFGGTTWRSRHWTISLTSSRASSSQLVPIDWTGLPSYPICSWACSWRWRSMYRAFAASSGRA